VVLPYQTYQGKLGLVGMILVVLAEEGRRNLFLQEDKDIRLLEVVRHRLHLLAIHVSTQWDARFPARSQDVI